MVQRDYVRKKSQSKKNKSRIMPNLMIFIATTLIILFSTFLYLISNNKPDKPIELPKVKTQPPTETLPEQPQERWAYLKALETPNNTTGTNSISVASERQQILDSFMNNSRVVAQQNPTNTEQTTTAPTFTSPTTAQTNKWILQCGAFKDKSNADTLRAKLAMSGLSSNITSGQLYRVTAGPYISKSEADKAMSLLKSNGINNCIISNK
ncbi:hypothetical protein A9G11_02720 [Gilliamella sp. wkB108]|uniref:SPOR domain-containing protein n=1 Tax=Gilliamella sp. wkB108 TaxID=3120256 RepID=UPI00080E100B|nr:SPOR domain-containing protein [Gilliamella apicola]OCG25031.1 hypothetical protein A9G11_02720 [Gilliamella apicola]